MKLILIKASVHLTKSKIIHTFFPCVKANHRHYWRSKSKLRTSGKFTSVASSSWMSGTIGGHIWWVQACNPQTGHRTWSNLLETASIACTQKPQWLRKRLRYEAPVNQYCCPRGPTPTPLYSAQANHPSAFLSFDLFTAEPAFQCSFNPSGVVSLPLLYFSYLKPLVTLQASNQTLTTLSAVERLTLIQFEVLTKPLFKCNNLFIVCVCCRTLRCFISPRFSRSFRVTNL